MHEIIELLESEIGRMRSLVTFLHEFGFYSRAEYRAGEIQRFQRILDLVVVEVDKELDWREFRLRLEQFKSMEKY